VQQQNIPSSIVKASEVRDWILFGVAILTPLFTAIVTWTKLTSRVNGLGGRLKKVEDGCAKENGRVDRIEREVDRISMDSNAVHERLGRVEKGVEGVNEHLTEIKVDMGGHLSEIKQLILAKDSDMKQLLARRDGDNRERIARLEAKADIPHRDRANDAD
jgi:hypothetical protein